MDMPKVDAALTATLSDPDDGVTGTTWQWSRSDTMDGTYTNIANATSASYTPVDDDVDKYLKAMASYTDTHRSNRTAEAKTANAVGSATPPRAAPWATITTLPQTAATGTASSTHRRC